MIGIQLSRGDWTYDPESPLGSEGGFGAVFLGWGENYGEVAIKRLNFDVGDKAHREIDISDYLLGQDLDHVIPVLDAGKDADSDTYFVIMARAEKSLQQELAQKGLLLIQDAAHILHNIASGLFEVQGIAHRDLKPANVLFHDGKWKIADFGISRFIEASTSLRTLNGYLTAPYAAPEQWKFERATTATDIYALGCIAYTLLTGEPPFPGPESEDYREQHLHEEPPVLSEVPPRMSTLLTMMLRKNPQGRPGIERILGFLGEMASINTTEMSEGFIAVEKAGAEVAKEYLQKETIEAEKVRRQQDREALRHEANQTLIALFEEFFKRIQDVAPSAHREYSNRSLLFQFRLGTAFLQVEPVAIPEGSFRHSDWDVVSGYIVELMQESPKMYVWGANLWYTNLGQSDYRWWEVLYMMNPLVRGHPEHEPFALTNLSDADNAASLTMNSIQFAAEPRLIDDEDSEDFCNRWAKLFADAVEGKLRKPRALPLK